MNNIELKPGDKVVIKLLNSAESNVYIEYDEDGWVRVTGNGPRRNAPTQRTEHCMGFHATGVLPPLKVDRPTLRLPPKAQP